MRPLVVALLLSLPLGGCARVFGGGGGGGDAVQSVPVSVDSTLRIAATQLQHHGYTVQPLGQNGLMTTPRPVPDWLTGKDEKMKGRTWFVQVNAQSHYLARGSRVEVIGFLIPESASRMNTGNVATVQNAVQVTEENPLFQEVRTIAGWIADAARRRQ
jgi:hypothetical protein